MSEFTATWIGGSSGPTHTGSGTQNNFISPESLTKNASGQTPRAVARSELIWLDRHFIEPEGYPDAYDTLVGRRTVLLDGANGDGRHATARCLLHRLPPGGGALHEILLEREEGSSLLLDPEVVADDDRLLLDLAASGERLGAAALDELSAFRKAVEERGAGLVVVLPAEARHLLTPQLNDLRREISRPPERELELSIIGRHLRYAGRDPRGVERLPPDVMAYLGTAPRLSDVATFAQYLCDAAHRAGTFTEQCALALKGLQEQPRLAVETLRTIRKGAPRALLITTAMLSGARADAVHKGAAMLLDDRQASPHMRYLLERRSLADRLGAIKAEIGPAGLARFESIGYDSAVRIQVWENFPDLRDPLRNWVARVLSLPGLTDGNRDQLVERFAEQCLSTNDATTLLDLAKHWASPESGTPPLTRLRGAAHALEYGLNSSRCGGEFRHKIYEWATRPVAAPFRKVLVGVCAETMTVRHPEAALVRLHHLARREPPSAEARNALIALVREDHRLHRRMLNRLARGLESGGWAADTELFLDLAAPEQLGNPGIRAHPLIAESGVRNDLLVCWTAVLRAPADEQWTTLAEAWLEAACGDPHAADRFLDLLVTACDRRGDRLGVLYRVTRDWSARQPAGQGVASELPSVLLRKMRASPHVRVTPQQEATAP
ncbi:hypothetical protein [Streptomyces beijiangensis]|uniref:Uncharacterized protein n=1 Tax=Streptomyces beijiangensis TaxID=163361 RepID=A0A939F6I5_9ACTN|nr:hypothetical protein [Streptomyces beijiangensis]MBO0511902.1 hypothetical protein [Streptomyces beijiangensis]